MYIYMCIIFVSIFPNKQCNNMSNKVLLKVRMMEETTAFQPLSKRRDMRSSIQADRYKCSPSYPMTKTMDAMTKH